MVNQQEVVAGSQNPDLIEKKWHFLRSQIRYFAVNKERNKPALTNGRFSTVDVQLEVCFFFKVEARSSLKRPPRNILKHFSVAVS